MWRRLSRKYSPFGGDEHGGIGQAGPNSAHFAEYGLLRLSISRAPVPAGFILGNLIFC